MDPTTIAPNCWDAETCNPLSTSDFDDNFDIFHTTPYSYVADAGYGYANNNINISSPSSSSQAEFISAFVQNENLSCPASYPACGLQTTMMAGNSECDQCETVFRYSLDLGALYFNILQIRKRCVPAGAACANTSCRCTQDSPYFEGTCSHWARGVCRRKMYTCTYPATDFIWRNYSDYDILFCSIGTDDPACKGCVACTDPACLAPAVHASVLIQGLPLTDARNYNCSAQCGEMPRTCWNRTCYDSDDCWPPCDPALYNGEVAGRTATAGLGLYVKPGVDDSYNTVEQTKCCNTDYCNFPNPAPRAAPGLLTACTATAALLLLLLARDAT